MGRLLAKRQLTSRFHLEATLHDDEVIIEVVKTSNGQVIPYDEPLFLVRARDLLAAPLLLCYRALIQAAWYPDATAKDEHLQSNHDAIEAFTAFTHAHPERMKLPNITRGK